MSGPDVWDTGFDQLLHVVTELEFVDEHLIVCLFKALFDVVFYGHLMAPVSDGTLTTDTTTRAVARRIG